MPVNSRDEMSEDRITQIVQAVQASAKYRNISPGLVSRLAARELAHRRNVKEAIKATRNKLHQVAGAYFDADTHYPAWLAELRAAAQSGDSAQWRTACLRIMRGHASTRERIPILETFFQTTLASIAPVSSVLDLACGLNPLAIPWMPLAPDAGYYACDIYADLVTFLNEYFEIARIYGNAEVCDLISAPPRKPAQLALLLKALPVLDQLDKAAGLALLRSLNARYLLVSFPAYSLGGRDKQMAENYETRFRALLRAESWPVQRFAFSTELAFLIDKGSDYFDA